MAVCEIELALNYLGGRRPLLAETLLRFAAEYGPAAPALAAWRRRQDRHLAFHDVHSLKGTAGMLGLSAVVAAAASAEAVLAEPGSAWPDAVALETALAEALAQIPQVAHGLVGG